jgi:hypothetical protein
MIIEDDCDHQAKDEHAILHDVCVGGVFASQDPQKVLCRKTLGHALGEGCAAEEDAWVSDCLPCVDQPQMENNDNGSQTTTSDFVYQSSGNQRDSGSRASADKRDWKIAAVAHHDRVIIEWCCGRNSMLGQTSEYSGGCKVIQLAIDDDLRTMAGLHKALRIINQRPKVRTLLWSAMPCAGGSPWQTLNIALGVGLEKIEARWRDSRVLWGNFVIASKAAIDMGGIVAIEWPERCKYCLDPCVDGFLKKCQFDQTYSMVVRAGLLPNTMGRCISPRRSFGNVLVTT